MFIYKAEVSKKGTVFENYFNKKLMDEGFELFRKRIFIGIDKTKKEIDSSFVCGNILFIFELKCINMSYAYQRGEINALNFRKDKLSNALDEVDKKAKWLASRPIGKNYKLPNNIYAIIPIVISPFVEYIWTKNDSLWLTKKIPRICTIHELIFLKDKEVLSEIIKKSYVKYIN